MLDRLAAFREQDLGAAATVQPDEDAPSDEYESWPRKRMPAQVAPSTWSGCGYRPSSMVESSDRSGQHCSEPTSRFLFDSRFPELHRPGTIVTGCSALHLHWALGRLSVLVPCAEA